MTLVPFKQLYEATVAANAGAFPIPMGASIVRPKKVSAVKKAWADLAGWTMHQP